MTHLIYVPATGLGKYNGFRGNRWLKNRIEIFKQYTCRSLLAQTNKNFILWVSWRPEEKNNKQVQELFQWCNAKFTTNKVVFTYHGVCFFDDKYSKEEARERLINSLHNTMPDLINYIEDGNVLMTIQPSDDCYHKRFVDEVQTFFGINISFNAYGFQRGYIMNYQTKEISEYNPTTNPPFFTIKFPKEIFIEPLDHLNYIGPYVSHEHIPKFTKYYREKKRGFVVGCHGENISTYYDHPFKGAERDPKHMNLFGLKEAPQLKFELGWKRWILKKLPNKVRRKLRYWFSEKIYDFLRN